MAKNLLTENQKHKIRTLYEIGRGYIAISKETGVSQSKIRNYLIECGVKRDGDQVTTVICKGCFTEFATTYPDKAYCSETCRQKYRKGWAFCEWCGKYFPKSSGDTKYCCRECSYLGRRISIEEIKERMRSMFGDEVEVISGNIGTQSEVTIKCNRCGESTTKNINKILYGGAPCDWCGANESQGEKRVKATLEKMGVNFQAEYSFDDLIHRRQLRYDFAILDDGGYASKLIEFDGQQHFKAVDYFGGEDEFQDLKVRDEKKNRYALENNIELLRIPYTEYGNIDKIVTDFLKG